MSSGTVSPGRSFFEIYDDFGAVVVGKSFQRYFKLVMSIFAHRFPEDHETKI